MRAIPTVVRKIACWLLVAVVISLGVGIGAGLLGPPGAELKPAHSIWPQAPVAGLPPFPGPLPPPGMGIPLEFQVGIAYQSLGLGAKLHQTHVSHMNLLNPKNWLREEFRVGWPFHCLSAVRFQVNGPGGKRLIPVSSWIGAGVSITDGPMGSSDLFGRTVPLRPLPLLLLFNIVFWSATVCGLGNALVWFRRFRRRGKGLCVECSYPTPHIVGPCPECGGVNDGARSS